MIMILWFWIGSLWATFFFIYIFGAFESLPHHLMFFQCKLWRCNTPTQCSLQNQACKAKVAKATIEASSSHFDQNLSHWWGSARWIPSPDLHLRISGAERGDVRSGFVLAMQLSKVMRRVWPVISHRLLDSRETLRFGTPELNTRNGGVRWWFCFL